MNQSGSPADQKEPVLSGSVETARILRRQQRAFRLVVLCCLLAAVLVLIAMVARGGA